MRKRNVRVQFWLTQSEYEELMKKVTESGLKRNAFLVRMISQQNIYPAEKLSDLNLRMDALLVQIRGMATNLNQITKIANSRNEVPHPAYLEKLLTGMRNFAAAIQPVWNDIREALYGNR